ncbi:MAG: hypothetical protein KAS32_18650, partial [Candidatus Peribacteraceae bacterium]|nr:hypothetical protein [Candidatus Peribacteraceae bacterium]
VVGVEKMTDLPAEEIAQGLMGAADAEKDMPSGLTFPGIFGLIASKYMYDYGLKREDLNLVSSTHHKNAVKNPYAQFRNNISPERISQSPIVSSPLHMLDCSPISDGAAACILSTKIKSNITIAASQISTDTLSISERDTITSFSATKDAMRKALKEANISRNDISHLEIHDCFSIAALINLEDLGYVSPGKGIEMYKSKKSSPTINKSGGLKACGHPVAATGIKQIIDSTKQLKSSGKKYALAQNFGGACASCAIHILKNSK